MNFTSEDVQKYARIALYWLSGILVSKGFIDNDPTLIAGVIGIVLAMLNFGWTLYGGRLMAKINALMQTGEVQNLVMKDKTVADAVPLSNVTAASETKVVPQ